ncbi:MAG: GGDEF domain-containing protein [Candidatus Adiutrix sp.]|jgi:diguanylate cyclase (GGDEF)-like protein|nr:GGDEF domain-containing protein [Candidatus Adiutrix sp.]
MKKNSEFEQLRQRIIYLEQMSEYTVARMLKVDSQSIAIRQELEQKRRGFSLMAELAVALERDANYENIFVSVSRRMNSILNMQRTAVLVSGSEGLFRASVLQGYPSETSAAVASRRVKLDPELLENRQALLVTSADPADRLGELRRALELPYLIASPISLPNDVEALLVTGRLVEQAPFLPRIGLSDLETVQTVSNYLAAMLAGHRLAEAEHLANYDQLTLLPNLRRSKESLKQILTLAKRGGFISAVMFIDLDGFKAVNDTHGHAAGDEVLRIAAERLSHSIRESDLAGRIGGDEFVVVLSRISQVADAGRVAEKIIEKLSQPMETQNATCHIGASIGIAIYPDHGQDEDALLKAADVAMYAVKSAGKNSFAFFQPMGE